MLPVKNGRITQTYGNINPKQNYVKGYHPGIDIVSENRDIVNIVYGIVIASSFDEDGWGNYIIVRGIDDNCIIYAHLAKRLASLGKDVAAGDVIGIMGATGNATGVHLHIEVRKGKWQDRNDIDAAGYLGIKNELGEIAPADPFENDRLYVMAKGISDGTDPLRTVTRREVWAMIRRAMEGGK